MRVPQRLPRGQTSIEAKPGQMRPDQPGDARRGQLIEWPQAHYRCGQPVAHHGRSAVVGLVERGQGQAEHLVQANMELACRHEALQRRFDRRFLAERDGQRPGIEQGHVGALAELRAGRMPGIADMDQPPLDGLA